VCVCSVPKRPMPRICNRLFDEFGLAQAIPGLVCLLPASALALLDVAALPAALALQD
jgi:hypothetical protein